MFRFEDVLMQDETILYQATPTIGKGNKKIGGELFVIAFSLGVAALMILSVVFGWGDGAGGVDLSFLLIFAVDMLFLGLCVYSVIYKKFIQDRAIADDYYCVTNQRILKYEAKKDQLIYGDISKYNYIEVEPGQSGYGNITFGETCGENATEEEQLKTLKALVKQDASDRRTIAFECIKSPNSVRKIVMKAQETSTSKVEVVGESTES